MSGYVALSAADTWLAGHHEGGRIRWITKPLLMPTLAAAMSQRPSNEMAPATYVGLAGSWVGDIALLNRSNSGLKRGLLAFSVAQSAYISDVVRLRDRDRRITGNPIARRFVTTGLALAPGAAIAAYLKEPVLGPAVAGYGTLLATHAAGASNLDPGRISKRNRRLRLMGAATFLLSDTLLGVRKFFLRNDPEFLEGAVMATYATAQLLIAESTRARVGEDSNQG